MSHEKELNPMQEESGFEAYEALMNPKELSEHGETLYVKEEPTENETVVNVFDKTEPISVTESLISVKEEPEVKFDVSEAARGLYAGHEVQSELVLGPRELRRPKYVQPYLDRAMRPSGRLPSVRITFSHGLNICRSESPLKDSVEGIVTRAPADAPVATQCETAVSTHHDSTISSCELKTAVVPKLQSQSTDTTSEVSESHPEQQKQSKSTLKSKPFCCDICKKKFRTKSNLSAHMTVHTSEKPYGCEFCDMRFKIKGNLNRHLQIHDERGQGTLKCDICQKEFTYQVYLNNHIKRVHSEKQYSCEICNKRFGYAYALRIHERQTHSGVKVKKVKPKQYPCEVCNKLFLDKSEATDHKNLHTGERPYDCDICKKKFRQKRRLALHHKLTHAEKKTYRCYICKMRFLDRDDLTKHKVIHTVNMFTCDICEKHFRSKISMRSHLRVHKREQVEKPHWCEVCDKKFTAENYLSDHMRLHREDRSLSCLVCKKQFMTMNNLSDHMKNHTGEKLFSCDVCNKIFLLQSQLNKHKRTHTGLPYACEVCKKQYRNKKRYTAHMNKCQLNRQLAILAEPPANQIRHQIVIPLPDDMTLSLTLDFV